MRIILGLPALIVILLLAVACGGGGESEPTPTVTPAATATPDISAPDQALLTFIQATYQEEYVGDCGTATPGEDAGKICTTYQGERGNIRAYVVGTTFTDDALRWVFLMNQGGWQPMQYGVNITPDNAGVPGIPWPMNAGDEVVIIGTGDCLNVREGPGLNQTAVDCINDGIEIALATGPVEADELQWWQVEGRAGWVVADYLRYPDATEDAPAPPSEPADDPVEEEPAGGEGEPAEATPVP